MDTHKYCLEKVTPFKYGIFFGISYISGVICNFHILAPKVSDKDRINYQLNNVYNLQIFQGTFPAGPMECCLLKSDV